MMCSSSSSSSSSGSAEAATTTWETMLADLTEYHAQWGNAAPPLNTPLGRWCATQRRMYRQQSLSEARIGALDALGFAWVSPSDCEDPLAAEYDWDDLCSRLARRRLERQKR